MGSQSTQVDELEYASQTDELRAGEYEPTRHLQSLQKAAPASEYVPAPHSPHWPHASGRQDGRQEVQLGTLAPPLEYEPGGQLAGKFDPPRQKSPAPQALQKAVGEYAPRPGPPPGASSVDAVPGAHSVGRQLT